MIPDLLACPVPPVNGNCNRLVSYKLCVRDTRFTSGQAQVSPKRKDGCVRHAVLSRVGVVMRKAKRSDYLLPGPTSLALIDNELAVRPVHAATIFEMQPRGHLQSSSSFDRETRLINDTVNHLPAGGLWAWT